MSRRTSLNSVNGLRVSLKPEESGQFQADSSSAAATEWTRFWPFPSFSPKASADQATADANIQGSSTMRRVPASIGTAPPASPDEDVGGSLAHQWTGMLRTPRAGDDDDSSDDEAEMAQSRRLVRGKMDPARARRSSCEPPDRVAPHPLASDWTLSDAAGHSMFRPSVSSSPLSSSALTIATRAPAVSSVLLQTSCLSGRTYVGRAFSEIVERHGENRRESGGTPSATSAAAMKVPPVDLISRKQGNGRSSAGVAHSRPSSAHLSSHHCASGYTITKDELTALISVFDTSNPLGARVDLRHMDLSWMVRRRAAASIARASSVARRPMSAASSTTSALLRSDPSMVARSMLSSVADGAQQQYLDVRPPTVHLHLAGLGHALDSAEGGQVRDKEILVNSPRSAVVLLRNGVTLQDLIGASGDADRSSANANATALRNRDKAFVTLDQLSWDQRKQLALETHRREKLKMVVAEYEDVCHKVSFDEIVAFCNAYEPDKPSSASRLAVGSGLPPRHVAPTTAAEFRPQSALSDTSLNPPISLENETSASKELCEKRLHDLADKFIRREQRIQRSREKLLQTKAVDREATVAKLVAVEYKSQRAVELKRDFQADRGVVSRGRGELWRAHRNRYERVETFHRMITRERLMRRLDEVAQVQAGMSAVISEFRDMARRVNVEEAASRSNNEERQLQAAKRSFLENQK